MANSKINVAVLDFVRLLAQLAQIGQDGASREELLTFVVSPCCHFAGCLRA